MVDSVSFLRVNFHSSQFVPNNLISKFAYSAGTGFSAASTATRLRPFFVKANMPAEEWAQLLPWKFAGVPMGFWEDKANHVRALDVVRKQLGADKNVEKWYGVNHVPWADRVDFVARISYRQRRRGQDAVDKLLKLVEECRFEFICLPDDVRMYSKNGLPILGAPGDSDSRTKKDTHPIRYPLTALSANLLIVINGKDWSKEILRREEDRHFWAEWFNVADY